MEIYLYEVTFEIAAEDAQTGGELLEGALNSINEHAIVDYDISTEVVRVVYTAQ
jgi:hypothetical protein